MAARPARRGRIGPQRPPDGRSPDCLKWGAILCGRTAFIAGVRPMQYAIERTAGLGGAIRNTRQVQMKWCQNESADRVPHAAGKETT
jgi:hypothetical protein